MTPAARYAAAIDVLDQLRDGQPAERCLTNWARNNRYAGSKDRAAVRDHVYDVLRAKRSLAALGGGETGRALVLGLLRREGIPPEEVFGAPGYGPSALSDAEASAGGLPDAGAVACDLPDWLWPHWQEALGNQAETIAKMQQGRAPVALRVNRRNGSRDDAIAQLAADDVTADPVETVDTGLIVTGNPRRVAQSAAYRNGLVELQDVASQIAMARLRPYAEGAVLDYCAGGGGKALALADQTDAQIFAHDIAPARMKDIPARAERAGVAITTLQSADLGRYAPFDLVFCDTPCSGSGTWRRTPEAKWALTDEKLWGFHHVQQEVLSKAAGHVRSGGVLAYATCSILPRENADVIAAFQKSHPKWRVVDELQLLPKCNHDGFFLVILREMI